MLKVVLILIVGFAVALFFFDQLFDIVSTPYDTAQEALGEDVTQAAPPTWPAASCST